MDQDMPKSAGYQQALDRFDATLDDVADAVAAVSTEQVRGILDRYKQATHQLLAAHRQQLVDDFQSRFLGSLDQRLKDLEELMRLPGRAVNGE